jgi:ABC-type transport system substrate-binding protein
MEVAPDKSWIIFNLRPQARWHDGKPITADDVIFSFEALTGKGDPFFRYYYKDVSGVEKLGELRVKFSFSTGGNRELPVIIGQFPILPRHFWETRNFENVLIEAPLGSGPYRLERFDLGRSYVMRRVPDYWGKDLPIRKGTENYDEVRIEYFRDPTVALEAFKSGIIDFRQENRAKDWATAYDIPAVKDGRVIKELVPHRNPSGMQGFVFNLRNPMFADAKVREALILAFDFEWSNKTLFFDQCAPFLLPELGNGGRRLALRARLATGPCATRSAAGVLTVPPAGDRWIRQRQSQPETASSSWMQRLAGDRRQAREGRKEFARNPSTIRRSSASPSLTRRIWGKSVSPPRCVGSMTRNTRSGPRNSTST